MPLATCPEGQHILRIRNGTIDWTSGEQNRDSDSVSWTALTGAPHSSVATSVRA